MEQIIGVMTAKTVTSLVSHKMSMAADSAPAVDMLFLQTAGNDTPDGNATCFERIEHLHISRFVWLNELMIKQRTAEHSVGAAQQDSMHECATPSSHAACLTSL